MNVTEQSIDLAQDQEEFVVEALVAVGLDRHYTVLDYRIKSPKEELLPEEHKALISDEMSLAHDYEILDVSKLVSPGVYLMDLSAKYVGNEDDGEWKWAIGSALAIPLEEWGILEKFPPEAEEV